MQLQLQTWQEVEAYLQTSRGIILPIGSTEQHGPTGLIGTDAICAEVIARGAGEAAGALVAPTISVGMAQHHLGFAGSMTLRPSTLIAVLDPPIAPRGDFADAADYRRKFPDGRIGSNPALATPEAGRRLYEAAVAAIAKDYQGWVAA